MHVDRLNEYQQASRRTWSLIKTDHAIVYPTLGLVNEAGEVAADSHGAAASEPAAGVPDQPSAAQASHAGGAGTEADRAATAATSAAQTRAETERQTRALTEQSRQSERESARIAMAHADAEALAQHAHQARVLTEGVGNQHVGSSGGDNGGDIDAGMEGTGQQQRSDDRRAV